MLYSHNEWIFMNKEWSLLYKNITLSIHSQKELKFSWCVREKDGDKETKTDCYIDQ